MKSAAATAAAKLSMSRIRCSFVVFLVIVYLGIFWIPIASLLGDRLFSASDPDGGNSLRLGGRSTLIARYVIQNEEEGQAGKLDHEPSSPPLISNTFSSSSSLLNTAHPPLLDLAINSSSSSSSSVAISDRLGSDSCDLYDGKWVHDTSIRPLYTNSTCPIITPTQNCQVNGRPDKDYENWRWQPENCTLPRSDARKFLNLMANKTVAFVGDSIARNQMESLICILWQEETPMNRGSRTVHRWIFRSTNTTIIRIWSAWLVNSTDDPFPSVPDKVTKVYLDVPNESLMQHLSRFDVVVLSSGHWFYKPSAYILNGTVVGGQLWKPNEPGQMQVNNMEAYSIALETSLTAIATHKNFTGLAVLRSYSPDHYEGGKWNTGGSCTGKVGPVEQVVKNRHIDMMHGKQVAAFKQAETAKEEAAGSGGDSRLVFMDITRPFQYRPDGHPGPYRSTDPKKITKRGKNGRPPPQDCLHWCMPGPVDTWNEILMELIRRDQLDHQSI